LKYVNPTIGPKRRAPQHDYSLRSWKTKPREVKIRPR